MSLKVKSSSKNCDICQKYGEIPNQKWTLIRCYKKSVIIVCCSYDVRIVCRCCSIVVACYLKEKINIYFNSP